MGQNASVQQDHAEIGHEKRQFTSNSELMEFFDKRAVHMFTATELAAFKSKLEGKTLKDPVRSEELTRWLRIPCDNVLLCEAVYEFVRVLSNFPLMKDNFDDVTGVGVLKSVLLTNPTKCHKYVGVKNYDHMKLLFIALSMRKSVKEEPSCSSSTSLEDGGGSISLLRTYNNIVVGDLAIPAASLVQLLAWLLILTSYCPTSNCQFPEDVVYAEWGSFKLAATNLLRTMDNDIVTNLESHSVKFEQFSKAISAVMPNIFRALQNVMEHLLYQDSDLVSFPSNSAGPILTSKPTTQAVLAQLITALSNEMTFAKFQNLYVGRESGFSMRSLQAKVFKWMAPTVMLLSGKCVLDDEDFSRKNSRYRDFLSKYPKLKDRDQHLSDLQKNKTKVVFAVYIPEPWKTTNKDYFGGLGTTIVQLSPTQDVFKAASNDVMYFNTLGGGIGIGNNQPHIKNGVKSYSPGNVSLTIDSTLEFAAFRHVGYGGTFNPGLLLTQFNREDDPFEIKFLIQDVEVWGCGGKEELEEQYKKWQWEEAEAKRRQNINLRSFGEDRALLEMAGLVGHSQNGGSM